MFGRATIRLGIGPHSSCFCISLFYIITTKNRVISGNDESIVMSQPADEEMETTSAENETERETVSISHSTVEEPGQTQESKGES